ncbi:MAG: alpha-L-fucosidase [Verrucomicrobia bacterium]|nr:alpha-L-fucosidase [Verrucomicrobiota bacterium]MBU4291081.1 alpha-L-fucosidase [Verrucomicrobiota bacterium]MBU4498118.1 alpha-L-fucosidase [Verrucomicrobiota bacterium]MCG2680098.1 alpha-L-fucosidase [Kiritimatiellia bacterium]
MKQQKTPLSPTSDPHPYGPIPSSRQLAWHALEFYGFLHFTVNTFTNREWGYGDENPSVFRPTDFNAGQIAKTASEGGMQGLILTCKHHDGFCLWPSNYTAHSVKNSPWKDGQGDVVREISDACRKYGLKFGVYLSPWDRNHPDYGRAEYIAYYRNQLRELLTHYGPIFEIWFDGANGGDGYYGGAYEHREIDRLTYYRWEETIAIVRELQPEACIFSDAGPDIRWIGNEAGIAGDPCWHTLNLEKNVPGIADSKQLNSGNRPGSHWLPGECDVSIRPGWFYHAAEDNKVRAPENLVDLYFKSVGRGASLNLNLPPDRRGRLHDNDIQSLLGFRRILDRTFAVNLAAGARVTAVNTRGDNARFAPSCVIDGNPQTYWSTNDSIIRPELLLEFKSPIAFNVVSLREYLPLGQRIEMFAIDIWAQDAWREFTRGTGIGSRRLIRLPEQMVSNKVRLRIEQAPVCPAIAELSLYSEETLPLPEALCR